MKLLVNIENTDMFDEIHVDSNDTIETLMYIIEATFGVPFNKIALVVDGVDLNLPINTVIASTKIKQDSMVIVKDKKIIPISNQKVNNNTGFSIGDIFDNTMKMLHNNEDSLYRSQAKNEAENIYNRCINDPGELSVLFNSDEKLAEAVASGSIKAVEEEVFKRIKSYNDKKNKEKDEYSKLLKAGSNDAESQKKIEAYIHKQQVQENKQLAMEHFPESFFSVHHMLYVPLEINSYKVIALVDTGAQSTIMSVDVAHKSGLYHLIDTDYKGKAIGVGESTILGVVHCAQIKIGGNFIMAKITIIENVSIGFILGLDNMRSHRCTIELSTNSLKFIDAGFHINFLSDGEIKTMKVENEKENAELLKKIEK